MVEAGFITRSQLEATLKDQASTKKRLGEIFVDSELLTEAQIATALSEQFGIRFLDSIHGEIAVEVIKLVPEDMARKQIVIPIAKDDRNLLLAMSDPLNLRVVDLLQFMSGLRVQSVIAPRSEILSAIDRNYRSEQAMYDVIAESSKSEEA